MVYEKCYLNRKR